jgi:hypothetical protein
LDFRHPVTKFKNNRLSGCILSNIHDNLEVKMKTLFRLVLPLFVLVILVLATGSLAFAKEFGLFNPSERNIEVTGIVETISSDQLSVDGTNIVLNRSTEMGESIQAGDLVRVEARLEADGRLVAREVVVSNPAQTMSAGFGSAAPQNSSTAGEIEVVGTLDSIAANSWVISGQAFAITSATEIKGSLKVGDQVKVHAYTSSAGVLTAREIELYTGEDNSSRHGAEVEFSGTIESMNGNSWVIGGRTVLIMGTTEIEGTLGGGDTVKVHASPNPDGTLTAREIELLEAGEDDAGGDS